MLFIRRERSHKWIIKLTLLFLTMICGLDSCAYRIQGTTDVVTIESAEIDSKIYVNGKLEGRDDLILQLKRG